MERTLWKPTKRVPVNKSSKAEMEVEAIYLLTLQAGLIVALLYYLFTK